MEMSHFKRPRSRDRRRRISTYSRYAETPRHLIVELNADGTDYLVGTDEAGVALVKTWPEVHYLLSLASDKLTLKKMLERWPTEESPPDRSTLSRWLNRASKQGLVCREGTGYSLVLVPASQPGVTVTHPHQIIAPHVLGDVVLDGVRVPADHRIGSPGQGFSLAKFQAELRRKTRTQSGKHGVVFGLPLA